MNFPKLYVIKLQPFIISRHFRTFRHLNIQFYDKIIVDSYFSLLKCHINDTVYNNQHLVL